MGTLCSVGESGHICNSLRRGVCQRKMLGTIYSRNSFLPVDLGTCVDRLLFYFLTKTALEFAEVKYNY